MKNLVVFVMLIALHFGAKANHNESVLVLKGHHNEHISVYMDGRWYGASEKHVFRNLRPGRHYVKVFKRVHNDHGHHGHNGHQNGHGNHGHLGHGGKKLIAAGWLHAYRGYKSNYHAERGRLILVNKKPIHHQNACGHGYHGNCPHHGCSGHPSNCHNSSCGHGGGHRNGHGNGYGNGHGWNNGNGCGHGNDWGYYNNHNWNHDDNWYGPRPNHGSQYGHGNIMNSNLFNQFMRNIKQSYSDEAKVNHVKNNINKQQLSVKQVNAILNEIYFEKNKLAVAKYLYGKTADKKNYQQIYPAFNFQSSKKELGEYIRKKEG